jgi:hypothetical protein
MDAVRKTMARGVDAVHGTMARQGLTRLAISATLLVIPGGHMLLAYPLLWAMMPEEQRAAEPITPRTRRPCSHRIRSTLGGAGCFRRWSNPAAKS